jgi:hypothetical protein
MLADRRIDLALLQLEGEINIMLIADWNITL